MLSFHHLRHLLSRPIGYGTVLTILVVTLLMTALFWKSQSPEVQEYSNLIVALSEFKYFDSKLDRDLELVRNLQPVDPDVVLANISVLRELGRNLVLSLDPDGRTVPWPELATTQNFEREYSMRYYRAERVIRDREILRRQIDTARALLLDSLKRGNLRIVGTLDTLWRLGSGIGLNICDSTSPIKMICAANNQQLTLLNELRNPSLQVTIDEMIHQFKNRLHTALLEKERIHQSFYLLSILTLLVVVALIVRIPR